MRIIISLSYERVDSRLKPPGHRTEVDDITRMMRKKIEIADPCVLAVFAVFFVLDHRRGTKAIRSKVRSLPEDRLQPILARGTGRCAASGGLNQCVPHCKPDDDTDRGGERHRNEEPEPNGLAERGNRGGI